MRIDVVSDIACPWCFIGATRLEQVLAEMGETATVVFHPFLLDPNAPDSGTDIRARLKQKYGVDPSQAFRAVEQAAADTGLTIDFEKLRMGYPTVRAHTLLRFAEAKGTQRALARALFHAYFVEAKNVADVAVLMHIASEFEFSPAEVAAIVNDPRELDITRAEAEAAARRGVRGVPVFIFNGRAALSGAQPAAAFKTAIERARAELVVV